MNILNLSNCRIERLPNGDVEVVNIFRERSCGYPFPPEDNCVTRIDARDVPKLLALLQSSFDVQRSMLEAQSSNPA